MSAKNIKWIVRVNNGGLAYLEDDKIDQQPAQSDKRAGRV